MKEIIQELLIHLKKYEPFIIIKKIIGIKIIELNSLLINSLIILTQNFFLNLNIY